MKHTELRKILTICTQNGVKSFQNKEITIEFSEKDSARSQVITERVAPTGINVAEMLESLSKESMPSDDELLFASAEMQEAVKPATSA